MRYLGAAFYCLMTVTLIAQPGIKHRIMIRPEAGAAVERLQAKVSHKLNVQWDKERSIPVQVSGGLTPAGYASGTDIKTAGINFITENRELFALNEPAEELQCISSQTDELAKSHVKYQQYYKGVKVLKGQMNIHFGKDGSVESINCRYYPTPELSVVPSLDEAAAVAAVKKDRNISRIRNQSAGLVIYEKDGNLILCYEVRLSFGMTPNYKAYVDANTGVILKIDKGIRYDGPRTGSGIGSDGAVKSLNTYLMSGRYCLIDASLPMFRNTNDGVIGTYDAANDTADEGFNSVYLIADPDNDNVFDDNSRQRAAVDAHSAAHDIYAFYKKYFKRNSFSNQGSSIQNIVHYLDKYNNAFWNGECMVFGDGDGENCGPFTMSLDIITHEFTHAVTDYSAGLIYENQSGALSESMSDVFACLADSADWMIGEDSYTPSIPGDALRNMEDPHMGLNSGDIYNGWCPEHMSEYVQLANTEEDDNGGVHVNCGITNKAFYNVATAIGRWKAGQIWYRCLTIYLLNTSEFADLRTACLNSAKDLFGGDTDEYRAVSNGFASVGLTGDISDTSSVSLAYDDGTPESAVYETIAGNALAVRFTSPATDAVLTQIMIYSYGDNKSGGNGNFTLLLTDENNTTGLPGLELMTPVSGNFSSQGWLNISGLRVMPGGNFFAAVKYNGSDQPLIGADVPPGNGRAYEYDAAAGSWSKLTSPNDYTLFMRATMATRSAVIEADTRIPEKFCLEQNYPNPFNPSTSIRYALPTDSDVTLEVYDISGRRIAGIISGYQNAGTYTVTWNGRDDSNNSVASGVYFYTLKAGTFVSSQKMILLK